MRSLSSLAVRVVLNEEPQRMRTCKMQVCACRCGFVVGMCVFICAYVGGGEWIRV